MLYGSAKKNILTKVIKVSTPIQYYTFRYSIFKAKWCQLKSIIFNNNVRSRIPCPNFVIYKSLFLQVKNCFATIVNGLSLFQLSNGDLLFSQLAYNIYEVCKPRKTKLGQGVKNQGTLQEMFLLGSRLLEVAIQGTKLSAHYSLINFCFLLYFQDRSRAGKA